MKKLILLLASCGTISSLTALEWGSVVSMPDRAVLRSRLRAKYFGHFEEKTKLSEQLTPVGPDGATVIPLTLGDVAFAVDLALYDYDKYLGNPGIARATLRRRPQLLETVLQDVPGAVEVINRILE